MTEYPEQLPCGVELESLLVQVADHEPASNPEHQATCPYCQAALESLRREWTGVQALAREPVTMPGGVSARTMLAVRELAVLLADSTLIVGPRGETRISHIAVARVAQRLAAGVPGVVFASARPVPQDPPHPVRLSIAVRLVVGWNPAITQIAQALRDLLIRRVPALTGAELARIDITIRDIAEPGD
jgi:hypothetical protein